MPLGHFELLPVENETVEVLEARKEVQVLTDEANAAVDRFNAAREVLKEKEAELEAARDALFLAAEETDAHRAALGRYANAMYRGESLASMGAYIHVLSTSTPADALHAIGLAEQVGTNHSNTVDLFKAAEEERRSTTEKVKDLVAAQEKQAAVVEDEIATVRLRLGEAERILGEAAGSNGFAVFSQTGKLPLPVVSSVVKGGTVAPLGEQRRLDAVVLAANGEEVTRILAAYPGSTTGVVGSVHLNGAKRTVLGVDPSAARSYAPKDAAVLDPLWQVLARGEALTSHQVATEGKVSLGGQTELDPVPFVLGGTEKHGEASSERAIPPQGGKRSMVRIGAFATLGWPGADVVTSTQTARGLGATTTMVLVTGLEEEDGLTRLRAQAPSATVSAVAGLAPPATAFLGGSAAARAFGSFTYRPNPDGSVVPDPAWVAKNIVTADVPILGTVRCHRLVMPQLAGALNEVEARGLASSIHKEEYGGCYVPREIADSNSLSLHTWGVALDVNVPGNLRGVPGDLDREVVAIFKRWGFRWGGDWAYTDPMHFELGALVKQAGQTTTE